MRIFTKKALKMSFAVAMLLGVAWTRPTATSQGRHLNQNEVEGTGAMRSLFETEDEPRDLKEVTITITVDIPSCESAEVEEEDDNGLVDFEDEGNMNLEAEELDEGGDGDQGGNQGGDGDQGEDDLDDFDDGNVAQEDENENPLDTNDDGMDDIDWVWRGSVIAPTDEGVCNGADFAFAITTAMEGQHQIEQGKLFDFSEQYLLDCLNNNLDVCNTGIDDITTVLDQLTNVNNAVPRNWNYLYTED